MSRKLLKAMLFMFLLCLTTGLFSQAVLWEDNFDENIGWTLEGNWSITASTLRLNWSPSVANYDMSAISPAITLPDNAGDFVITQWVNDYSTDDGEVMEIWVINGDEEDLLWDWDLDENDDWGVSGGQELLLSLAAYAGETIQIKFRSHGGTTFNINYWYIYNVKIYGSFDNDLAAVSFNGNVTPTQGMSSNYNFVVRNGGSNTQSTYTAKLMKVVDGDDEVLVSLPGVQLAQGELHTFVFEWTPDFTGPAQIYAFADLPNDDFPANNQTGILNVNVQASGTVVVTVGDPETTTSQTSPPANFFFKTSLSQTIYFSEEIQIGGLISAIQYKATLQGDIPPNRPLKFWMAETTINEFDSNTSWLPHTEFTLVFDGTVDLTSAGIHELTIPLTTPFVYGGGNLVVMCQRPMDDVYYSSNNKFFHTVTPAYPNRTIVRASDSIVFGPEDPGTGSRNNTVPLTGIFFNTSGMGHLEGVVTRPSDNQPVEGVRVALNGTPRAVYTNEAGEYVMNYIPAGTIGITASKVGYIDTTINDIVIEADENTTQNISITQLPTVAVTGQVIGTDAPTGVSGVLVRILGYVNYETLTDASGNFTFPEVYQNQTYEIRFTRDQYAPHTQELVVGTTPINLGQIELQRVHYTYVGNPESTITANTMPINFYWKNSLTQTIYLDNEINMGGLITSIEYYAIMNGDVPPNSPIKVWMATTETSTFANTTSWLPYGDFTLVFDGTIDVTTQGEYPLEITLDDPFVYTGGNLVVMVQRPMDENYYSSLNHFRLTEYTGQNRTLHRQSDSVVIDPMNPETGTLSPRIPNAKIYFNTEGLGNLAGIVTNSSNNQPIEGARVALNGTNRAVYTDANGAYEMPYLFPGTASITVTKHTFFDNTLNATITADELTTLNVPLTPRPTVTVTGRVVGNDAPDGLNNCDISLTGYADYFDITTNATGHFTIPGVFAGATYSLRIQRQGYQIYTDPLVEVGTTDLNLGTITLNEVTNPPRNLHAEANNDLAYLTWNSPSTSAETEFRYDSGVVAGQLGVASGNENMVLGAAHRHNAVVTSVSWYLTTEGGPHNTVKVWVVGLNAQGVPDITNILFSQSGVPNIDGQWNTLALPQEVAAPNGFFIGVSYNGFVGLAMDDGNDPSYPFTTNTQYATLDITSQAFAPLESLGAFAGNFFVRATGIDNGSLNRATTDLIMASVDPKETAAKRSDLKAEHSLLHIATSQRTVTSFSALNNTPPRALTHYRLSRSDLNNIENPNMWELINQNIPLSDSSYTDNTWATVTSGEFKYILQAVYTGGVTSAPAYSNTIAKNMTAQVTVSITTSDGAPVNGAIVRLVNNNGNPNYIYQQAATGQNVVFNEVWKGNYTITVTLAGYSTYLNDNFNVLDNTVNLAVTLNVSNYAIEDDFESYESFALNFGQWTLIDGDMSPTYGFTGITFPNSGSAMAYIIFAPSETTPPLEYSANSGIKMAASFAATNPPNNDYMVSPLINVGEGAFIKFHAASYTAQYGLERFRVLAGTSSNPTQMTVITPGAYVEAPVEWTEFTYSLNQFAGQSIHVAIHCVSDDAFIFFVDDVYVERGTSVSDIPTPRVTQLTGNYPNPFNPTTTIKFDMAKQDHVEIEIFNIKGQKVRTLVNDIREPGFHEVTWTGTDNNNRQVGSGVYFYRMKTSNYSTTKKMLLVK